MHPRFQPVTRLALAAAILFGAAACSDDPEPAPKAAEPIVKIDKAPPPPPEPERVVTPANPPSAEGWKSSEAPNACDVMSASEAAELLGAEVKVIDSTDKHIQHRKPVASACYFAFGRDKDPDALGDDAKFVRVQVFTNVTLKNPRNRTAESFFKARRAKHYGDFELGPGFEAFWTTSDHPPDRSLLIHNGEVVIEVQSYPPSSGGTVVVSRPTVEAFALSMYEKWL
jgi:hypothetical protein